MQVLKNVLGVFAAALVLTACDSVDFKKTKAGVPYKIFNKGKGDSIRQGSIVKFEVIQKTKDTLLFSSYDQGRPQYFQVQEVPPTFTYNDIQGNLMEIFHKAKKGDSVYMTQAADSLLKENPQMADQLPFKKGDQIITTIKILDVYKTPEEAQAAATKDRIAGADKMEKEALEQFKKDTASQAQMSKDNKIIEEYLAKNNIQAQKTDWGVYVQIINPGQGPKPKTGQYASIRYKGSNLAGQEFDSGEFPFQVGLGGAIKGFDEGVKQLAKGGKAKIFIPSVLGYGANGSAPRIAPNENLVFEIEVLDLSDTPPSAQQPVSADPTKKK